MSKVKVVVFVDDIPFDATEVEVADKDVASVNESIMDKLISYESTKKTKLEIVN